MTCTVESPMVEKVGRILSTHWRPSDWFECTNQSLFHYAMKAAACARFRPRSVIEIGTRCGYSLMAFHAIAPKASYLCIDGAMDADSLHCLAHAKSVIETLGINASLIVANSHEIKSLPPADFAHVDGDHSFEGALADLRLVAQCRGILADDVDNPHVRRAVERFCLETAREVEYFDDGMRKGAIIT